MCNCEQIWLVISKLQLMAHVANFLVFMDWGPGIWQRPKKAPMLQVEGLCALVSGCEELVTKAQQHGTVIQVGCLASETVAAHPTGLHSLV